MEIGPIAGIRAMPVRKIPPADPELSALFDIQNSTGPGDDTYSGSGKKAAGGQDDEADEPEEGGQAEDSWLGIESGLATQIDFIA